VAMKQAEVAVRAAEVPEPNVVLANYRVYIADRKVDIAAALARTSLAEDQRVILTQQRDKARLDSRTREADVAASRLATAKVDLAYQTSNADAARNDADASRVAADAARMSAADSAQQSADLQRQLDDLHAKQTDRGIVLTLGDVLFSSGRADLKVGATSNLNRLVAFLNHYPDKTVIIEGYTDSIGGADYNLGLSQRRADSVKSYLAEQGIGAMRLTASGNGLSNPVAGNDSEGGRQQNRRVEVIIASPPMVLR
jgi:outer membrane protein OmpA-like peptidoglycan-associated protein